MLNERNTLLEDDGIEEEILVEEECSVAQAVWGDIQGNIENQTDLQNALDAKQDSLTESQLNAVNSGITAEKVTTYDGYADQIASKADQSALSAEATTREQADTALGRRIDDEATARQSADNGLQTQIDAITSKSDVVDVVANYASLQAYDTSTLGNNDVVKVLDDETHEDALTYYRWSTATQTWSYIGQEAPYYSKGQMDVMLQGKQDKLTAGANIQIENGTISATDTTYTAGNGLNLNGTEFSADTDVLATKEDLEGYYTKPETDNLLAPKLEAEVVAELPTTGEEGKLYLTPKAHTTQTATGNPIEATVAEDAGKIESFQLDGDTFQQSYTGKNLFDISKNSNAIHNEETSGTIVSANTLRVTNLVAGAYRYYFVPLPDTSAVLGKTITLSVNAKLTNAASTQLRFMWASDGWYTTSLGTAINPTSNGTYTLTVDVPDSIPSGSTRLVVGLYGSGESSSPVNSYVEFSNIQVEIGSSKTSYEPFVGGQPSPNPSYPRPIQTVTGEQTVTVIGKNLFSGQNLTEDSRVSTSNGVTYDRDGYEVSDYIEIEPSTNYALTCGNAQNGSYFSWYDSTKTYISGSGWQNKTVKTSPANASYIRFDFLASEVGIVQFEKGSVSSYVPYSNVSYPINLGTIELCKIGAYQDYIYKDGSDWKVHKATGKTILTDSTSFTSQTYGTNVYVTNGKFDDMRRAASETVMLASSFGTVSWNDRVTATSAVIYQNLAIPGEIYLEIRNTSFATLQDLTTYLGNRPVSVYYELATPTDTTITDTDLIAQLETIRTASLQNGANTITNTATGTNLAGDMEIGYYGFNPRNRYDKWLWLDINNEYEQIGS